MLMVHHPHPWPDKEDCRLQSSTLKPTSNLNFGLTVVTLPSTRDRRCMLVMEGFQFPIRIANHFELVYYFSDF